jgi:hypothetical protein
MLDEGFPMEYLIEGGPLGDSGHRGSFKVATRRKSVCPGGADGGNNQRRHKPKACPQIAPQLFELTHGSTFPVY